MRRSLRYCPASSLTETTASCEDLPPIESGIEISGTSDRILGNGACLQQKELAEILYLIKQ